MQFCIIGAGRSGTLMLAGMLNICGAYLGEQQDLMPGDKSNELGYWEHLKLNQLVLDTLAYLRGKHGSAVALPEGWHNDPGLDPLYERARAATDEIFGDRMHGGWKYGNATLVVPFWRKVAPDLKFIICVRNPADYVSSLEKMFGSERSFGYYAWLYDNVAALNDTIPAERIVCFYESFFPDYRKGLFPVLDFLGLQRPKPGSDEDAAINQFHRPDLRHHAATFDDLSHDPDSNYWISRLYLELQSADIHAESLEMLSCQQMYMPLVNSAMRFATQKNHLTNDLMRANSASEAAEKKLQDTEARLNDIDARRAQAENDLALFENRTEWLESVLSSRTHRAASRICDYLNKVRRTPSSKAS